MMVEDLFARSSIKSERKPASEAIGAVLYLEIFLIKIIRIQASEADVYIKM